MAKTPKNDGNDESDERKIDWGHPSIPITGLVPGYLVKDLFGFEDTYFPKWLRKNPNIYTLIKRKPWIYLEMLGRTNDGDDDDGEENQGEVC